MAAIDTVLVSAVNPGAGPTLALPNGNGDSLQVRSNNPGRKIYLEGMGRMGAAAGFFGVRSPSLHDNTTGLRVRPVESPSVFSIPAEVDQVLQPTDALITEISGGAAETDIGWLSVYYEDLGGINARLHRWAEVSGNIKQVKTLPVAVVSAAVVGQWSDTLITVTEDSLIAGQDYAVLGYMSNSAYGCIGIKGAETGNLRICGPGSTQELATTNYFVRMDRDNGRPWVPVINAANKGGLFVSVCANGVSVAGIVTLILAQLNSPIG